MLSIINNTGVKNDKALSKYNLAVNETSEDIYNSKYFPSGNNNSLYGIIWTGCFYCPAENSIFISYYHSCRSERYVGEKWIKTGVVEHKLRN